ncbi:MAG TPA: Ig-like domain-containing domain [Bacteroidales bacterium]|nr:hypothetical protein [Bacteroidales bacterium]HOU95978.1 Ig-like domain-containing domain [Bacteroidales bacterium]HQG53023.1 Ig-like domain-containing domain [Bacteroidales bacterium]HQJ20645.1 Ig-like domain-containing domain [Bacteroidales bacterium]
MIRRLKTKTILIVSVIIFTASCAKIVSPSGGPKDTEPPVIIKSIPPSGAVLFKGNTITITFNEYIVLDKLNEKFMISPPMEQKPNITVKGKTIKIEFRENLKDNTTYTLYFQDAIKDLNEGNPLVNYQFVFSTGSKLDSLSVTGNVLRSEDLNPAENVLVMLHSCLADTAPRKNLPDYVIIADPDGYFRIDNIKTGMYKLYGLVDNNNNKKYDLQDEMFAFSDSILNINPINNYISKLEDSLLNVQQRDTAIKKIQRRIDNRLFLFKASINRYYLSSSSRNMPYQLTYALSLPPDSFSFDLEGFEQNSYLVERNKERDTMTVWLLDSLIWSQPEIKTIIKYPFTDSSGKVISRTDTIIMRYFMQKQATRGKEKPRVYKPAVNITGGIIKPNQKIIFTSPLPFANPDTSKIKLYQLQEEKRSPIPFLLYTDSISSLRYYLEAKLKDGVRYMLIADRGAFRTMYGDVSDSSGYVFSVRPTNEFGQLIVHVKNVPCKMVIKLLDNDEKLIDERKLSGNGTVDFPLLERGKYRLKAIYDLNGDNKWTTGNYDLKIQPEPVSYYLDEIDVKINWIIEQDWDVGTMWVKSENLKKKKTMR